MADGTVERFVPGPPRDIPEARPAPEAPVAMSFEIAWGDLDSAQIVYTGRLPEFAIRAVEKWFQATLGADFYHLNRSFGIDTPFGRLEMDFLSPVLPAGPLVCTVYVERLGRASVSNLILAHQDGRLCFVARTVSVFVDQRIFKATPMTPNVHASFAAYVEAHPAPEVPSRARPRTAPEPAEAASG